MKIFQVNDLSFYSISFKCLSYCFLTILVLHFHLIRYIFPILVYSKIIYHSKEHLYCTINYPHQPLLQTILCQISMKLRSFRKFYVKACVPLPYRGIEITYDQLECDILYTLCTFICDFSLIICVAKFYSLFSPLTTFLILQPYKSSSDL